MGWRGTRGENQLQKNTAQNFPKGPGEAAVLSPPTSVRCVRSRWVWAVGGASWQNSFFSFSPPSLSPRPPPAPRHCQGSQCVCLPLPHTAAACSHPLASQPPTRAGVGFQGRLHQLGSAWRVAESRPRPREQPGSPHTHSLRPSNDTGLGAHPPQPSVPPWAGPRVPLQAKASLPWPDAPPAVPG